jgi:hypothetical protein
MNSIRGLGWPLLASITACVILAVPLWCVASPPMPDYPAHLASFYLIGGGLSHYYRVEWAFLPNLAGEAIIPFLAKLLPLEVATKLFLSVAIAMWVLGPAAIQRALFGKVGLGGVIAAAFAYNAPFMWGFFNYYFAAGFSFFVFAAWILSDANRKPVHFAGFALAFMLVYFAHLFALVTLLMLIGCFEISGAWRERRFSVSELARRLSSLTALCVPAGLVYLFLTPHGDGLNVQFNFLDTMAERFEAAIQFHFDLPAYALTGSLIVAFAAGFLTRHLTVASRMIPGLIALFFCTLLAPEWALGGWGVHFRLPAVLGVMLFAASDVTLSRQKTFAGLIAMIIIFLCQAAILTIEWQRVDLRYKGFRAAASDIRPGARLLTVLDGDSLGWSADQPYWHMAEFAVIDRGAFTPLLFATRGQHIIRVLPPMNRYAAATAQQGSPPDIDELNDLAAGRKDADEDIRNVLPYLLQFQCYYDQAVVIHGDGPLSKIPQMLHLTHSGSFYALYDIVPDEKCSGR